MNRLRQLIHEIHRRSLWQVLLIYVGASWAVLQVVDTVAGALQLPDWLEPVALVLLIVGLPVVLATAFVQEGISRGDEPAEPDMPPASATGLFTWRNAFGGGVLAFALWGVVAAGWVLFGGGTRAAAEGEESAPVEQSVAVLPFVNMSGDPDNEYFSDGITEELLNALAQIPDLRVPARTSSFAFKGQNIPVGRIADTLNVVHILEGSVRRDGERVAITAQLVNAQTDTHLWSETYERRLDDIFAVQREIASAIADQLEIELRQGETLVPEPTRELAAYDLYLRGRKSYLERLTLADIDTALARYADALASDPEYALAHAAAAEAWSTRPSYTGGERERSYANAQTEARAALALDESLALPQLVLATVARGRREWPAADSLYRVAIERLPSYPEAHHEYGEYLGMVGRCADAESQQRRALELDPLNGIFGTYLAYALTCEGHVADALAGVERNAAAAGRELRATGGGGTFLILAMLEAGRTDEAVALARGAGDDWRLALAEGMQSGASRVSDLEVLPQNGSSGAWGAALLGDAEAAIERVEACAQGPCGSLAWVWMPAVRRLIGDDERYRAALNQMGLRGS